MRRGVRRSDMRIREIKLRFGRSIQVVRNKKEESAREVWGGLIREGLENSLEEKKKKNTKSSETQKSGY